MEKGINHVAFCMDSCRWDSFNEANAPHFHNFTKYRKVYSHAGFTFPSLVALFANVAWYNSKNTSLIPWQPQFIWVPKRLRRTGYYTALITQNPHLEWYSSFFKWGFDKFKVAWQGLIWAPHHLVNETIEIFEEIEQPKFVFLLLMETHQPYLYPNIIADTDKFLKPQIRSIQHQVEAIEKMDAAFGRLVKKLEGTNTDVIVFSDHGDLDYEIDGEQGHGTYMFHEKLFEIPLGRRTI